MKPQKLYWIWLMLTLSVMTGCVSTYRQTEVRNTGVALDRNKSVSVSVPEDGRYADDLYRGSGEMAAAAVKTAFSRHSSDVMIMQGCDTVISVKVKAPERNGYFVKPSILHWEERVTEWSGKPDRIEIQIQIYELSGGIEVGNYIYTGKSKWATFGGDHPQDLLPEPTQKLVDSLYKK